MEHLSPNQRELADAEKRLGILTKFITDKYKQGVIKDDGFDDAMDYAKAQHNVAGLRLSLGHNLHISQFERVSLAYGDVNKLRQMVEEDALSVEKRDQKSERVDLVSALRNLSKSI